MWNGDSLTVSILWSSIILDAHKKSKKLHPLLCLKRIFSIPKYTISKPYLCLSRTINATACWPERPLYTVFLMIVLIYLVTWIGVKTSFLVFSPQNIVIIGLKTMIYSVYWFPPDFLTVLTNNFLILIVTFTENYRFWPDSDLNSHTFWVSYIILR